jgi:hypothetical protein
VLPVKHFQGNLTKEEMPLATFTVSENGPYTTINDALVDAIAERTTSQSVQTIVVHPKTGGGVYSENIDVSVDGIQINGIVQGQNRVRVLGYYKYQNSGGTNVSGGKNVLTKMDLYRVIFTGSNYQQLTTADIRLNNSTDHTIEMTNDGYNNGYSSISINGGSFTPTSLEKNALYMTHGYLYANNVQFSHSPSCVSVYCTAGKEHQSSAKSGIEISTGSFVGQFDFELAGPVDETYTNLNLYNVSVRTEGASFPPIKIRKSKAVLSGVTLVNPQSTYTIDVDTDSKVSYKNIVIPAGTSTLPVGEIPRSRISADIANAGGIVVNDDQGRLSSILGNVNGQSVIWNAFSNRWEIGFVSNRPSHSFEVSDASTWVVGDSVCIVDGSLGIANYLEQDSSDSLGVIETIVVRGNGPSATVTVALAGNPLVSTDLSSISLGTELFVGLNGKLVPYSGIADGKWITLMGKVIEKGSGAGSGRIALNIRQIGTKQ